MNRKRMDEGRLLEEILPAFAKSADYTHTLMFVRVCLFSTSIDIFIFLFYGGSRNYRQRPRMQTFVF